MWYTCVYLCVVLAQHEASFQVLDLTQDTKVNLVIFVVTPLAADVQMARGIRGPV